MMKKSFIAILMAIFALSAGAQSVNTAKVMACLNEHMTKSAKEVRNLNAQYYLKDMDKDGKKEIFIKIDGDVEYVLTVAYGAPQVLIEKLTPEEKFYLAGDAVIVNKEENGEASTTVYTFRASRISDSATCYVEKENAEDENSQVKKTETPNFERLVPAKDDWKLMNKLKGWKKL